MKHKRTVEVIDEFGRTGDGGLVLDKECLDALGDLLAWRCNPEHHHTKNLALAANNLGDVIYARLGLEFPIYT